ncbi:LLM class flavin-dependent oxidoreductase [Bradyrhizobium sp.]|uniref:LLM class flavin-dependent oxidoreductase n=1 Tax=Bradyrhizobium sp. TaxID=376 RepID=UPI002D2C30A4|nr:LLM class flavin-dependent oxidoreductase [Bradyrhizobium sp.]HZR74363.1 LLM class flavin-dependent oxidoreductase [Bradyrhizobium sp.]
MGIAIGLGCADFPFSSAAAYWRWIDMCEAGGVDSIWPTDRIVSRQPFLASMTTMAALAGRTRRMRFGMNVVSLGFRDPVLLAKQCATIDMLSEGRLLPSFGIGSPLAPEWQTLGIDAKTRGRKTDECLEIIRRLWREESVDFKGAFYKLNGVTIAPKPVQPDLPMWIGGSSDAAIRRTARIGTGWLAGGEAPAEAGRVVAAIKAAATEAGRTIDEDHYGAGFAFFFGSRDAPGIGKAMDAYTKRTGRDAMHAFVVGRADMIVARIAEYVDAGASKFILRPLGSDDDAILDQTRLLTEQVLPRAQTPWPKRPKDTTTDR